MISWPVNLSVIHNKYERVYCRLISKAVNRSSIESIVESHHIIPDCFFKMRSRRGSIGFLSGNSNNLNNLVNLTPKEHYIAHRLLTKFLIGSALHKMIYALDIMAKGHNFRYKIPSRVYENNIRLIREIKKGKKLGPQKKKRGSPTKESNEKRREKLKGVARPDMRGRTPPNKGVPMSTEQREKLKGPRGPMSEEHKIAKRGKRGPLKKARLNKPRGPYKSKGINNE